MMLAAMSVEPQQQWKSGGFERLKRAFSHQTSALRHGLVHDPGIRQVTIAVAIFASVAIFLPVGRIEKLLLVLSLMLVGVMEVLNSALEACVDRISTEQHPLSGQAKDYASLAVGGSVLMCAVCWLVIAGPVVWRTVSSLLD
jgi:diacylglycerol kinase (ATP)